MDFEDVIVKESPGVCRCCLSEGCYKDLGSEYLWMEETEVYADMLLECFDISISQHSDGPNGMSRLICEVCVTRLRDACNFKKQVLQSEKRFIDMVARGDFENKDTACEDNIKLDHNEEPMDSADVDYFDEGIDFDGGNNESEEIAVEPIKIRSKPGRPKRNAKVDKKSNEATPSASKTVAKGPLVPQEGKQKELSEKLTIKRRNIENILLYSNATPFLFYKGHYRCFYCRQIMKDPVILREHTANVHQYVNLEAIVYDRTKTYHNKDAATKIDVTDLKCRLCFKSLLDLDQFIHHLTIAHDMEYDMTVSNCLLSFKLDKYQSTCSICNMKFVFFEYLLRHANKYHLSHDYICDVCGTSFQGENHLQMHNRYYHKEGGYKCDHCGINFATLSKKFLHERNVHLAHQMACPYCTETFKSPYFKKLHLANVHGVAELKIKCRFCAKVFPQQSLMSKHMRRVHLKEKNVECPICGDKFFEAHDVKLHMLKHSGDKKFVCSVCGKQFAKIGNLNQHLTIHNGKKPFECSICLNEFAHRSNLNFHMKSNHPEHLSEKNTCMGKTRNEVVELAVPQDIGHNNLFKQLG
ncbi:zinc finger protein 436-like isoform X6 [Leptidea sinapis]|uniref:zinc finger protein 436-like isoform X6 n=1 Tax=Leptidea sinapis TaxID=189913 RepID=UPI0021C46915|nr:zinc finger protein 436-like isoform X6 [Leptidea sinapis]